jgi:hypothetical protein
LKCTSLTPEVQEVTVDCEPLRLEVVDEQMAQVLRGKSSVERVAMTLDANRTMRLMLESHFRSRNPEWPDEQVNRAVARRILGDAG